MVSPNPSTARARIVAPVEPMPTSETEEKLETVLALVASRAIRPNNGVQDPDYWTFRSAPLELLLRAPASVLDLATVAKLLSVLSKEDEWLVMRACPLDRQTTVIQAIINR